MDGGGGDSSGLVAFSGTSLGQRGAAGNAFCEIVPDDVPALRSVCVLSDV